MARSKPSSAPDLFGDAEPVMDDGPIASALRSGYTREDLAPEPEDTTCIVDGCGGSCLFDPLLEGLTCGGNRLAGWLVCDRCGGTCITRHAKPAAAWSLTGSGRSVDAGGCRLRADGGGEAAPAIMARVARLPKLEAALRQIARGDADPVAIARAALGAS